VAAKGYAATSNAIESKRELPRVMAWLEQH
jgi:hypothetical protein